MVRSVNLTWILGLDEIKLNNSSFHFSAMQTINEVAAALKALKGKTLILTHHNADIDAISSATACRAGLAQIGNEISAKQQIDVGVAESVGKPAQKLAEGENFIIDPDCKNYDNIILVETSVPEQLVSVKNLRADIIIDHHPQGKLVSQAKYFYIDENAKSAAQIIFLILKELGNMTAQSAGKGDMAARSAGKDNITAKQVLIDKKIATAIACGIVADSAHLRLAGITELEIRIELLKTGISLQDILTIIESPSDASEHTACLKAAMRMEVWKIGDALVAISRVVSHEAAACRGLIRLGADVAVVVAEREKEVRISSRGKNWIKDKGVDLSVIFKGVGEIIGGSGGGHDLAGSANGPDRKAIKKATLHVVHALEEKFGAQGKRIE